METTRPGYDIYGVDTGLQRMTPRQTQILRSTWKIFQQINPDLIGEIFYGKLFAAHPYLRKMFPKHMEEQYRKLIDMMSLIVARIDRPETLMQELVNAGRRHIQYGVKAEYYQYVGEAFMWTLEKGLGNDWNEEVSDAWTTCYNTVANIMAHPDA